MSHSARRRRRPSTQKRRTPSESPPPPSVEGRARLLQLLGLLALLGCGREEVVHGVEERQANQILVALDESGVRAEKSRDDGTETEAWSIAVSASDAPRARRILAERELPRPRPPGFGEIFGKGSMVPTPTEERALYMHALAGELARSVEAVGEVLEARVHLTLPPSDPLRTEAPPPTRAALLVKVAPGRRGRVEPLAPGLQSLVAGAVAGLEPAAVSVVIVEAAAAVVKEGPPHPARRVLLIAAAVVASAALTVALTSLRSAWSARRRVPSS